LAGTKFHNIAIKKELEDKETILKISGTKSVAALGKRDDSKSIYNHQFRI
jgi:hypothetical protein